MWAGKNKLSKGKKIRREGKKDGMKIERRNKGLKEVRNKGQTLGSQIWG